MHKVYKLCFLSFLFIFLIRPSSSQGAVTVVLADNGTQVTAANINRGTTNNVIYKISLTVAGGSASEPKLSWFQFLSSGTYAVANLTNLKLWLSADASFGGDVLLSTMTSVSSPALATAGLLTFPAFTSTYLPGGANYIFITADIAAGATLGNTIRVSSFGTGNFGITSGTSSGSSTAPSGYQTFAYPAIAMANNGSQPGAANVAPGTVNHILHRTSLTVTSNDATLTAMQCVTVGTYQTVDLTNLKVRYSTDGTLDAGDATLSTYSAPATQGTLTFPSFVSQLISSGTTGYIFITADVAAGATIGRTINVNALNTTGHLTFTLGTQSGSSSNAGIQTVSTPGIVLADNAQVGTASVPQGTRNHVLNKISLTVSNAAATLTGLQCTTVGTYIASDIVNLKAWYSTDNVWDAGDATLSTFTSPGTAGIKVFSGFTSQVVPIGTGYIFVTADIFPGASAGRTISVNAIGTGSVTVISGSKSGTPTNGGVQTFSGISYSNIYEVTLIDDAGVGSLRQAIANANASAGRDYIYFNIAGAGPHDIALKTSTLFGVSHYCGLTLTDDAGVTIDGFTNLPNYGVPSTVVARSATTGTPMKPDHRIVISTDNSFNTILHLNSDNNIIKGLVITNYGDPFSGGYPTAVDLRDIGILIGGDNNKILGCYVGTDVDGVLMGGPYQATAIYIYGDNNEIGDVAGGPEGGNLIGGSSWTGGVGGGIRIEYLTPQGIATTGGDNNIVCGNLIGLQMDGTNQIAGTAIISGIHLGTGSGKTVSGNIIGGTSLGLGNVISGNGSGIDFSSSCNSNFVYGNIIGPCADGVNYVTGNRQSTGIFLSGNSNTIGGNTSSYRNIISGNEIYGIAVTSSFNNIKGNYIGPSSTLTNFRTTNGTLLLESEGGVNKLLGLSNQDYGIYLSGSAAGNTIGGSANSATLTGEENIIAFNMNDGIYISGAGSTGNRISRNSIYSNSASGKPINLNYSGTPGNSAKAIPLITTATIATIAGTSGNGNTIEIFKNTTGGAYDAVTYVDFVVADGAGNWSKAVSLAAGNRVMATATDGSSNTSEFSAPSNPLPVQLQYFRADCNDGRAVVCHWATASESNNDFFTVERSANGSGSWQAIGTVQGAGNSSGIRLYSFADEEPSSENLFYRLKQTDFNGHFEYFNIVPLNCDENNAGLTVFPNPSTGSNINIQFDSEKGKEILLVLLDVNGKETYSRQIVKVDENQNLFMIDLSGTLAPGIYLVKASSEDRVLSKKIVVK